MMKKKQQTQSVMNCPQPPFLIFLQGGGGRRVGHEVELGKKRTGESFLFFFFPHYLTLFLNVNKLG